jgi:Prp8 binding protein
VKHSVSHFRNAYSVTSVAFSDNGEQLFSGGIDNEIKVWDLRKDMQAMKLEGHTDSITGVSCHDSVFYT